MPTCAHTCVHIQAHTRACSPTRVCTQPHAYWRTHSSTCMQSQAYTCSRTHAYVQIIIHTHSYMHRGEWTRGASPQGEVRKTPQASQLASAGYSNCLFILPARGLVITPTETGLGPRWAVTSSFWHGPASTFQQHSLNVKMHMQGPVSNFINWLTMDKPLTRFKILISPAKALVNLKRRSGQYSLYYLIQGD